LVPHSRLSTRPEMRSRAQLPAESLFRFVGQKGVAVDLKQPRLALAAGTVKGVHWRADARQAAGNSIGPQIDVADRRFRHRLAIRDVGELQAPARP
jgi:hypothetical protein